MRPGLDTIRISVARPFRAKDDWHKQGPSEKLVRIRDAFVFIALETGHDMVVVANYLTLKTDTVWRCYRRCIDRASTDSMYRLELMAAYKLYRHTVCEWYSLTLPLECHSGFWFTIVREA